MSDLEGLAKREAAVKADAPEMVVQKHGQQPPLWRKLFALVAGLVILLVGLIICVSQDKPGELATIFITFGSACVTMVGAFMAGNASEHKSESMGGAVTAIKALASMVMPAKQPEVKGDAPVKS